LALHATEQPINTGTAAGKAFLDMLGVFAEFETNLRKEREAEGIALQAPAAEAEGGAVGGAGDRAERRGEARDATSTSQR
jgi:DNA invertase Pin-like site-specific DNA recombinase